MLKLIIGSLALAASLPVAAQEASPEVRTKLVRFHDLNLATPEGIAKLERRIDSAARRVCGYREGRSSSYILLREVTECMNIARAGASEQVAAKTGATLRKG